MIVSIVIAFAISLIVYLDAKKIGIRKNTLGGVFSGDPLDIAIACFLLLIIALPLYAFKRNAYRRALGLAPAWKFQLLIWSMVISYLVWKGLPYFLAPECEGAVPIVKEMVSDFYAKENLNVTNTELTNVEDVGVFSSGERTCNALVKNVAADKHIIYRIKWKNRWSDEVSVAIKEGVGKF
jgi:hypothetical protein